MKKRFVFSLITAIIWALPCFGSYSLLIHLTDGSKIICSLEKEPQMTFAGKTITLTSLDGGVGQWNFSDVDSWSFLDNEIIDAVGQEEGERIQVWIQNGRLIARGSKAENLSIYDVNGRLVTTSHPTTADNITFSLSRFSKGNYLIKVGKSCIKFSVK